MAKKDVDLPSYRIMVVRVNKDDPEDVQWDFSEFGEWEVPALFSYILRELDEEHEMAFMADDEEDEDDS